MESNNLLSFVNNVSSNIQVALDKATPKRRRHVTVKKFVENRVKRLDNNRKPIRPSTGTMTKSKSAQPKPSTSARLGPTANRLVHSYTWPEITTTHSSMPPVQTSGVSTCAFPTALPSLYSNSELCLPVQQSSQPIDPELESLLSEFESTSVPLSRHGSFDSVRTVSSTSCTPPLNQTLEAQVYIAEQAFSPAYSEYSDELDSAYCSPVAVESARVSYNGSPTNFGTAMPDWHASDLLPPPMAMPPTSTCLSDPDVGMMSSACSWVSQVEPQYTTSSSVPSVYDQGPPMTPTVSQLLEQYNQY